MKNIWSGRLKIVMLGASMQNWRDLYLRLIELEQFLSLQLLNQHWTCLSCCGRYTNLFLVQENDCTHLHLNFWLILDVAQNLLKFWGCMEREVIEICWVAFYLNINLSSLL